MATGLSFRMLVMCALSTFAVTAGVAQSGTVGGSGSATGGQEAVASAPMDNGAEPGDTHVRIVRLSEVKGSLSLDRKTGLGFEQTMPNMPIVQGEKLRTADGFAEVEYEDNTTLRLAPETQVDFELLALRSSGAKASLMDVKRGTVYVSTESTKGNEFLLRAGEAKIAVGPSTHLRMEVNETRTVLSVFNGNVEVTRNGETKTVGKKESLTLGADNVTMAKVASGPYDGWDKESNDYHAAYSRANSFAGGGNAFGLSDLNYYGGFVNTGCGQMWQPYLTSAGWSPYSNGLWAYYPGAGYSWVSPYPWGWLPYHSGSWAFCQGAGWGWMPGNNWYGLNNIAMNNGFASNGTLAAAGGAGYAATGSGTKGIMHAPLRPSEPGFVGRSQPSMSMSNQAPMVMSGQDKMGNFVFQKNSAGLGVPRGSLGELKGVSNDVQRHGTSSMSVYAAPAGGMEAHGASRGGTPMTLRQASPNAGGMNGMNGSFNNAVAASTMQRNNGGNTAAPSASPGTASRGGSGGMAAGGSSGAGGSGAHSGGMQGAPK